MQSPDFSQNFFELFGLAPIFEIDKTALHSEQRRLQSSYHPDRFASASEQEKRLSVQAAAWINQAFDTLRDPVKRSRYLLELNGAELPDDSATTSDTAFLMEQIELREQLDACRDADDPLGSCDLIADRLEQRAAELAAEFSQQLGRPDLDAALQSSRKMQFVQRIQQQLGELRFELEDL